MGCNAVARVKVNYSAKTADGSDMLHIRGAKVMVLKPGGLDWEIAGYTTYPELFFNYPLPGDGEYSFKHCTQRNGVVTKCDGKAHCVIDGPFSTPVVISASVSPPVAPAAPLVVVPCPDCDQELAN